MRVRYPITEVSVGFATDAAFLAGAGDRAEKPGAGACRVEVGEQWAAARLSLLGNYGLPVLYGLRGAMAFVPRRFHDRMADDLLTLRDQRGGTCASRSARSPAPASGCPSAVRPGSRPGR